MKGTLRFFGDDHQAPDHNCKWQYICYEEDNWACDKYTAKWISWWVKCSGRKHMAIEVNLDDSVYTCPSFGMDLEVGTLHQQPTEANIGKE